MSAAAPVEYHCIACGHVTRGYETRHAYGVTLDESTCSLIGPDGTRVRLCPRHGMIIGLLMRRLDTGCTTETIMDVGSIESLGSLSVTVSKMRKRLAQVGLAIVATRRASYGVGPAVYRLVPL